MARLAWLAVAVAAAALGGCSSPRGRWQPGPPGHPGPRAGALTAAGPIACYDLPGAPRMTLRLGPDGQAYWIERVLDYAYDGDATGVYRLMRMDLATGLAATVFEGVDTPLRLLDGGDVLFRRAATADATGALVRWSPTAGLRVLTPTDLDVFQYEVSPDQRRVVLAAHGRGETAIYALDFDGRPPRWLARADQVYAVTAEAAIALANDVVVQVPLAGGAVTELARFATTTPYDVVGGAIIHYDDTHVFARPLTAATPPAPASDLTVVGPPGNWDFNGAPDQVFLARRDADGLARALRLEGTTARPLPSLRGGAYWDAAVALPDGRWLTLVAHDTDHDGEADDPRDEDDVCVVAASREPIDLPTRHLPRRLADREAALAALAASPLLGGARWFVVEDPPGPPTLTFQLDRPGGDDLPALRLLARQVTTRALRALGEPVLRLQLDFSDARRASSYLETWLHRRVSVAGIGEAVLREPGEYDLERLTGVVARGLGGIACSGEVRNLGVRPLRGVAADCVWGNDDAPVPVSPDPLPPGAIGTYAATLPDQPDAELGVSFTAGHADLLVYDGRIGATQAAVLRAAASAYDRSALALERWASADGAVTADLVAPAGFGEFSTIAQEIAAQAGFDALAAPLREALDLDADAAVVLHLKLADGGSVTYDGRTLARD